MNKHIICALTDGAIFCVSTYLAMEWNTNIVPENDKALTSYR